MDQQVIEPRIVVRGDVSDEMIEYARDRVRGVVAHASAAVLDVELRLDSHSDPARDRPNHVEVMIDLDGTPVRAHRSAPSMTEAIDLTTERLRRRVEAANERPQSRQLRHRDLESWHHADRPTQRRDVYPRPVEDRVVVRRKTFALRAESIEEALFDLETLDHDFFLFVHDDTNAEAVVYRTSDGYGLSQRVETPEAITRVGMPLEIGRAPSTTTLETAVSLLDETDAPFESFVDADDRARLGCLSSLRRQLRADPRDLTITAERIHPSLDPKEGLGAQVVAGPQGDGRFVVQRLDVDHDIGIVEVDASRCATIGQRTQDRVAQKVLFLGSVEIVYTSTPMASDVERRSVEIVGPVVDELASDRLEVSERLEPERVLRRQHASKWTRDALVGGDRLSQRITERADVVDADQDDIRERRFVDLPEPRQHRAGLTLEMRLRRCDHVPTSGLVDPESPRWAHFDRVTDNFEVGALSSESCGKWFTRRLFGSSRAEFLGEEVSRIERDRLFLGLGRCLEMRMTVHGATSGAVMFCASTIAHAARRDQGQRAFNARPGPWPLADATGRAQHRCSTTKAAAMDPVLQAIRERRSVRRYTSDPIDDTTLDQLLEAAVWAPSAINAQPWAFGIIRDRSLLERYAERIRAIYLSDPPAAELAGTPESVLRHLRDAVSEPGYDVFYGASTLVTIYATAPRDVPDCFLAGENLMLAAHAAGLGSCPIGLSLPLMNQQGVKDELGVPASFVAALPIIVGHPAERPHSTTRNPANVVYRR